MEEKSSGVYIINKDYDIISYNSIAEELYPQLKKGEKCYKCLMGLDKPCPPCPVFNKIKGPKTYFDPIRKIFETVDAVPVGKVDDGDFALVFSTTGEREKYAQQLPTNEKEFNSLYDQEYYDKLTGGYSVKGIIRETEKLLKESKESDEYSILYFNIKNFKAINDAFGLKVGDNLLIQAYQSILNSKYPPLAVARSYGDRFVVLIKNENVNIEFLNENSTTNWIFEGRSIQIHSLCGIYKIHDKNVPVSGMIDRAKLALESIDDEYLNSCAFFDEKMHIDYISKARVLADYDKALKNNNFEVYYQPIIDIKTSKPVSAEALIRWNHPKLGIITPNMFVPVLEKTGHISRLDNFVLKTVYQDHLSLKDNNNKAIPVSINLSWKDLSDDNLKNTLTNILNDEIIPKGYIRIETTETGLNTMENLCGDFLKYIRECGSKILLDDFGSGYSSFGMVQKYDFDILKIDRAFISNINNNFKAQVIVKTIISMCHELNIKVVAEGVETKDEFVFLKENNCDYIQGYYYAKPMNKNDYFSFLERNV